MLCNSAGNYYFLDPNFFRNVWLQFLLKFTILLALKKSITV